MQNNDLDGEFFLLYSMYLPNWIKGIQDIVIFTNPGERSWLLEVDY